MSTSREFDFTAGPGFVVIDGRDYRFEPGQAHNIPDWRAKLAAEEFATNGTERGVVTVKAS